MKKQEFLSIVRKQIRYIFVRDAIEEELKQHLNDSMEALIEEGLPWQEAEEEAVRQMGDPVEVGVMLNKEHKPLLGYLLAMSRIILFLLIIYIAWPFAVGTYNLVKTLTPCTLKDSVETYAINLDIDLPTHKVKIDNICLNEKEEYCITFRAWPKLNYSRAGWSTEFFHFEDKDGKVLGGSAHTSNFIASYGTKDFEWPEDSLLYIVAVDGEVIELDLTEYCDEKK
jgi:hypothetical protein